MKIKNLKIYSNNFKTRLVALSLVGSSMFGLGGCGSIINNEDNEINNSPSIVDIIDCLASKKGLTLTDENLKETIIKNNDTITNIDNLLKKYNEAIIKGKKKDANEVLYYMGITSCKSLVSEIYNIPFDKIENLDVNVLPARRLSQSNKDNYDYTIKFRYNNVFYTLLFNDKLSKDLIYCINTAKDEGLGFRSTYRSIDDAYNIIKASLLFTGERSDLLKLNDGKDCNYIGLVSLYYDYDKLDLYYDYFTLNAEDITELVSDNKIKKLS